MGRFLPLVSNLRKATAFASRSHCPYFNLAFEDWIFRNTPSETPILLFYRNNPSVVIGRNQNPWKEINQEALRSSGIPFIRRKSGGGTVYHDLGNTNYSILIPRTAFQRRPNAELVARGLVSLGVPAEVNDRNDIVVEGFKMSRRKHVSGSAYKIVNKRAYHHGTMLLDAKLDQLGSLLHNTQVNLITKGVQSVRSPVKNIKHWAPDVTHDLFLRAVAREFASRYGGEQSILEVDESLLQDESGVESVYSELQTWDWAYGQTPEFTNKLATSFPWGDIVASIASKHGRVTSMSLEYTPPLVGDELPDDIEGICLSLSQQLVGHKYGILDATPLHSNHANSNRIAGEVLSWLRTAM